MSKKDWLILLALIACLVLVGVMRSVDGTLKIVITLVVVGTAGAWAVWESNRK